MTENKTNRHLGLPTTYHDRKIFIWFLGTTHYSINHVKGILVKTTKIPNYMSETLTHYSINHAKGNLSKNN